MQGTVFTFRTYIWYCVAEQMTEIDSAWLIVKLVNPQWTRTIEWAFWPPLSALESVNMKNTQIPDWISISKT